MVGGRSPKERRGEERKREDRTRTKRGKHVGHCVGGEHVSDNKGCGCCLFVLICCCKSTWKWKCTHTHLFIYELTFFFSDWWVAVTNACIARHRSTVDCLEPFQICRTCFRFWYVGSLCFPSRLLNRLHLWRFLASSCSVNDRLFTSASPAHHRFQPHGRRKKPKGKKRRGKKERG